MRRLMALIASVALLAPTFVQGQGRGEKDWLAHDQPVIALTHVQLVDGSGGAPRQDMTVVIRDGRIAAVGPSARTPAPAGAEVIDGAGKTVLPGFVMMHEHMFYPTAGADYTEMVYSFPRLYLAGGVTTLRTAGTMNPYADLNLRALIEAGAIPGPDMDVTAPYLNGPGLPILKVNALGGVDDAQRMVEYWDAEGVTSYKAYMHIRRDELQRIIETAHRRGRKVTAHLCSVTYREAVEMGIDNLEHGFFAATDFTPGKQPDVCPDQEASMAALAALDPNSPEVRSLIRLLVEKKVALTSTLTIIETLAAGRPRASDRALSVLMPQLRERYLQTNAYLQAQTGSPYAGALENLMAMERMFVEAGGHLMSGTDPTGYGGVVPGFSAARQVQLLVEAGFGFPEAVRISTLNGARFLGRESEIGQVKPGLRADLVLIDGDPVADIAAMERMPLVFKAGRGYRTGAIIDAMKDTVGLH